jgi:hypothetical protein
MQYNPPILDRKRGGMQGGTDTWGHFFYEKLGPPYATDSPWISPLPFVIFVLFFS